MNARIHTHKKSLTRVKTCICKFYSEIHMTKKNTVIMYKFFKIFFYFFGRKQTLFKRRFLEVHSMRTSVYYSN